MRIVIGGSAEEQTGASNVVLVDIELGVRVGRARSIERDRDIGGIENLVKLGLAPRPVVVERLWIFASSVT